MKAWGWPLDLGTEPEPGSRKNWGWATDSVEEAALGSPKDWAKDWLELDRDQLTEFLKCNDLTVPSEGRAHSVQQNVPSDEYKLWQAVFRWLSAPNHTERGGATAGPLLASILPLIRCVWDTKHEKRFSLVSPS